MKPNTSIDIPFFIKVAAGEVPGWSSVRKFGENPDLDTAAGDRTIWDFPGAYIIPTTTTEYFFSSSNNSDTQVIFVQGVDINGLEKSATYTLAGQTKTSIGQWRLIYRAFNTIGTVLLGNVYFYQDSTVTGGIPDVPTTVKAYIAQGKGQTEMLVFMTPKNKRAFVYYYAYLVKRLTSSVSGSFWAKEEGKVERKQEPFGLSQDSNFTPPKKLPITIPPSTIFRMSGKGDVNDIDVGGVMDIFLEEIPV